MKAKKFKALLNWFMPYLGAGIKIEEITDDWRYCRVSMTLRWYNRNAVNTHFGGSLYSMVDPHYMLLLMQRLGREYTVWDKAASIDFIKPGTGRVWAEFHVTDALIDEIKSNTANGEKYLPVLPVEIKNEAGELVCKVEKTLYIRRRPQQGRRI